MKLLIILLSFVGFLITNVHSSIDLELNLLLNKEYIYEKTTDNDENIINWWKNAVFYQIYPRSFKDTNRDGIGDLLGILNRLFYLRTIGVNATWLSPIFKSPMADFGYDISNYYDIQPEYGTLQDFKHLLKIARKMGVKMILDFVPNHTSDEHEWFQKSIEMDPIYKDYYIWHSGLPDPNNSTNRLPPSNWISVFYKSAWQWNTKRNQFYLHQFGVKQPDLNYRNPKVVEEMKSVLRFWLKLGVSGFRIDAVPFLFEKDIDENGYYWNEPTSGNNNDPNDYGYLNHIYTVDQKETLDMVYQWRNVLDEFNDETGADERIMMTEAYSPMETIMQYYGNETVNGSQIPFNFGFITRLSNYSNAYDIKSIIDDWLNNMPNGRIPNWVMGNHDQRRIASRLGTDRIDSMHMILFTLPGVSVTYNGEELGMTDVWISWKDTVDPAACNTNPNIYEKFSRDPERTPYQWNDGKNAGFSDGNKTWLPVASNYREVNAAVQIQTNRSHFKNYMELTRLKREILVYYSDLHTIAINQNVFCIVRKHDNEYGFVSLINFGNSRETINLVFTDFPTVYTYFVVSLNSNRKVGDIVKGHQFILEPKESFILKTYTKYYKKRSYYYLYEVFNNHI